MRLLVYVHNNWNIINTTTRGQDINSYNVNAILNVDKFIEINQIMKFKNTSNIQLDEIFLKTGQIHI